MRVATIAGREVAGFFAAPVAYVVGVLFLVAQGFSFWAVVGVLADPRRPAPLGAVLRTFFGGTFLYWSVLFAVLAAASMRLLAEDRRQGTWETLLTTPVSEAEAVVGKWLGGLAFYLVLWVPTLAFVAVLHAFAPPGSAPEAGPIVSAYVGVAVSGAGLLALAMAAASTTRAPVIAAVAAFVALLALLLVGQVPELVGTSAPGWLEAVDLRAHLDRFARGVIDSRSVLFFAGLAVAGLALAIAGVGVERRRPADAGARATGAGLIAVIAVLVNTLAFDRVVALDLTGARVNSLEEPTAALLAGVDQPVTVLIIEAADPAFFELAEQVENVVERMAAQQPRLTVQRLVPSADPASVDRLADEFALSARVLGAAGAVVFRAGNRQRAVELLDTTELGIDALGAGRVERFAAERTLATALRQVIDPAQPALCTSAGHGEIDIATGLVAQRLRASGYDLERLGDLSVGVPSHCDALLVLGPRTALSTGAATAVDRYLTSGGRLLLAIDSEFVVGAAGAGALQRHGLEAVIAERGIRTPDAVVLDPGQAVGLPLTWRTATGYSDHPAVAGFSERRYTAWVAPRLVAPASPPPVGVRARALVTSSASGWAETDIADVFGDVAPGADDRDLIGAQPVAVAAETDAGARLVVLGSAAILAPAIAERRLGATEALVDRAVGWLVERTRAIDIEDKTPEQVRLVLGDGQRAGVFALCVVALPALFACLGGLLWWRRRRG